MSEPAESREWRDACQRNQGRLPPGRHGFPKEWVLANQRERIMRATAAEIRNRGFSGLSVARVIEIAGVSRFTFYELFENKIDCVLATHRDAVGRVEAAVATASEGAPDWSGKVAAAVGAVLEFAASSPVEMNLILVVNNAVSEPQIAGPGLAVRARLIAAMRLARGNAGSAPPEVIEQAAIGAAGAVIGGKILAGEEQRLPDLKQDLAQLILAPYLGEDEAKRIALAA